jgi:hypothetical protein
MSIFHAFLLFLKKHQLQMSIKYLRNKIKQNLMDYIYDSAIGSYAYYAIARLFSISRLRSHTPIHDIATIKTLIK